MELLRILQLLCILGNVLLGGFVYLANPRRAINRQFFVLTFAVSLYLCFLNATAIADTALSASVNLRLANIFGMGLLFCTYLLQVSVVTRETSIWALLKRSKIWLAVVIGTTAICLSPYFINGITLPSDLTGSTVPLPDRAWGFHVVGLALTGAVLSLIISFLWNARRVEGVKRTECYYLATGSLVAVFGALIFTVLLPAALGRFDSALLVPFSFLLMDIVVAYGIARSRILRVGEMVRSVTAYGLMTIYFVVIYSCVFFGMQQVSAFVYEFPSLVSHLAAALAVAYSFAPANGLMQRFANKLFISVRPLNVQSTMTDANRLLSSLRPLDDLLGSFSQLISQAVGSDQVRVLLLNEDEVYQQQFPALAGGGRLAMGPNSSLVGELSVAAEPLSIEFLERQRDADEIREVQGVMADAESSVAVGIRAKGRLEGMLLLGRRVSGRMYSKTDLDVLQLLSDQLGVAIENAKLYTAVQESREYNEKLVEKMVSGVVAVDGAGKITTFNQEAQRLTGIAREAIVGKEYKKLPAELMGLVDGILHNGDNVRDLEIVLRPADSEPVPLRIGAGAFRAPENPQAGVLLVFHDLSLIRRLESQVRKSDRLASIGTIAAGMAHEIKNPLVAIKTFTQLLPERYEEEEFRDTFSSLIASEVTRIDSIVNQLLDFARPAPPILTRVHVHELLKSLVALLQHQCRKKNVTVLCEFEAPSDVVTADANQLEQALMNLVLNALDAMDGGGTLTISTMVNAGDMTLGATAEGEAIGISVRDTGEGISEEKAARIFDPFFTTKQNGTGLGLSVTHRIVEDHGGRIEVDSDQGDGTVFHMYFPLNTEEPICELAS